jgi:hypothetical protein
MKQKLLPILFALACVVACEQPAGTGAEVKETLDDAATLAKIGANPDYPLDGDYTLGSDLTLDNWRPIGTSSAPFTGTFNGNGKTLAINGSGGLFGFADGAVIRNLTIEGTIHADGSGTVFAGAIVGNATETTIADCVSRAAIAVEAQGHNSSVGGIAGFLTGNCKISDCLATGNISLKSDAGKGLMLYGGGIAGYQGLAGASGEGDDNSGCVIERCAFTGSVTVEGGYPYAGGIVGYNYFGAVLRESFAAEGTILARGENIPYAGGVAGYNSRNAAYPSRIENCHSDITVSADSSSHVAQAGGIAGANAASAAIFNCYARGSVAASALTSGTGNTGGSMGPKAGASAGGIAGAQYFEAPAMQYCVALNSNIEGKGGVYNVNRIANPGDPNYSAGVLYEANIANAPLREDGSNVAPTPDRNGPDGGDCDVKPAQSAYEALGWDFASVWTMADGYPVLRWQRL